ncbi:HEAT repeat domain-containing protein [Chitiniphilus purpureus]|uniref:HEAT repeat domain-containing protein n=1 Tax=Chitiniphilus purpureus TaxID=2981137 RepID=A0ABY6DII4_9NEIS|nr:HEAT repeat domain-containing protein [Chitiniphilus sp. CD1]UXY14146.1 HEAT repeat domain-containing protein [Chitiniphilus sp. CD1]
MALIRKATQPPAPTADVADPLCLLQAPDPSTRAHAAQRLALQPGDATVAAALLDTLAGEPEAAVRERLLTALIVHADTGVAARLAVLLRQADAPRRTELVDALRQMPDAFHPLVPGLLADPDPDLRIHVLSTLDECPAPQVRQWLVAVLEHDPHVNVCAGAVEILARIGEPAQLPALHRLKARFPDAAFIAFAADLAAARIQGHA